MRILLIFHLLIPFVLHAKQVDFYTHEILTIEPHLYTKPIHISYGEVISNNGNHYPEWLETYVSKNQIDRLSYGDWIKLFSPEYLKKKTITEIDYHELIVKHGKRFGFEQVSILYDVHLKKGNEEFYYVLINVGPFIEDFSKEKKLPMGGRVFEKIEKRWVFTRIDANHWVSKIIYNNISYVEDIVDKGSLILSTSENNVPSYIEGETKQYPFFK